MELTERILSVAARLMLTTDRKELVKLSAELGEISSEAEQCKQEEKEYAVNGFLKFTEKETMRMPKEFRKTFRAEGCTAHVRKRTSGRGSCNYEIRYRKHGYNIAVSSNDLTEAKKKFIDALHAADRGEVKSVVPSNFGIFAEFYFTNYRARKVKKQTMDNDLYRYRKHILPRFGTMQLKEVSPSFCQTFIDEYSKKGMTKTANELKSLLNGIFKLAVAYKLIDSNPLAVIIVDKHNSTHSVPLSKDEERRLLEKTAGTRYQRLFAVALYTGMRPNEFVTARIEGDFILANNSKRKGGKVETKRIPICIMLRPFLEGTKAFHFPRTEYMRKTMKKILPNHILKDLRKTFYTRLDECEVAPAARDEIIGHSQGVLHNTYSYLSDEYLLEEGKKIVWDNGFVSQNVPQNEK